MENCQMRILLLLIVFTLFCSVAFPQTQVGTSNKDRDGEYARRDLTLERAALAQRDKIDGMMPPWVRRKLNIVFKEFMIRLLRDKNAVNFSKLVKEELEHQFANLSAQQSNILTLYTLASIIRLIPPHAERSKVNSEKDSIDEMSQMDLLRLQQMMEKKSQLETMISNIMKAGFEAEQAAIQALKAS
jgi:Na+-transporting NADH:ubiquinone oxidoreductase subunit NqrC